MAISLIKDTDTGEFFSTFRLRGNTFVPIFVDIKNEGLGIVSLFYSQKELDEATNDLTKLGRNITVINLNI